MNVADTTYRYSLSPIPLDTFTPPLKTGKVIRGWLGLMDMDITPDLAWSFGTNVTKGVIVASVVPGSPAEKGGLKRWDIVESLNGRQVENNKMLSLLVPAMEPGSPATIEVILDGKPITVKVTIGTYPQ